MNAVLELETFKDLSYLKRFMMSSMALGKPLLFSLHGFKFRESEQPVFTFTLKSDVSQESWPSFISNRSEAMLRGKEFLKLYNCQIDSELDIDEQYVKYAVNA